MWIKFEKNKFSKMAPFCISIEFDNCRFTVIAKRK
jgi:hypothetical protein